MLLRTSIPVQLGAMYVPGRDVKIWPENRDHKFRRWEKFTTKAGKLAAGEQLESATDFNGWTRINLSVSIRGNLRLF